MKKTFLFFAFAIIFGSVFGKTSDVITLMNELKFEGQVKKIKDCEIKFKTESGTFWIPSSDISTIEFADVNNKVYTDFIQQSDNSEKCLKGSQDAQNFHGKTGGHVVLGVLFGPFAVIGAAIASPTPYKGKNTVIMSQNEDLFNDPAYLECYKKKAKGRNVGNTFIGWGVWILAVLIAGSGA